MRLRLSLLLVVLLSCTTGCPDGPPPPRAVKQPPAWERVARPPMPVAARKTVKVGAPSLYAEFHDGPATATVKYRDLRIVVQGLETGWGQRRSIAGGRHHLFHRWSADGSWPSKGLLIDLGADVDRVAALEKKGHFADLPCVLREFDGEALRLAVTD